MLPFYHEFINLRMEGLFGAQHRLMKLFHHALPLLAKVKLTQTRQTQRGEPT
jgi:hypothetical protein